MSDLRWYERQVVQLPFAIVVGAFVGWLVKTPGAPIDWHHEIATSFFAAAFTYSTTSLAIFSTNYAKMRSDVGTTLNQLKTCVSVVLGPLKGVAQALEDAHTLDKGKMGVSIPFAIGSLQKLTDEGFLEVDIPYHDFLTYVENIGIHTSNIIFGTSVIRRPIEIATDDRGRKYAQKLLQNSNRRLVRVTALRNQGVSSMIEDALKNMESGPGSPPATQVCDIPEVQWWVDKANQVSYQHPMVPKIGLNDKRLLFWTTHEDAITHRANNRLILQNAKTIDDYAVFDDMIVFKFRDNPEHENGILFQLWGNARINEYKQTLSQVDKVLKNLENLTWHDLGLFTSFYELLSNMMRRQHPSERPAPVDMSPYPLMTSQFGAGVTSVHLPELYAKIIELVNSGKAQFKTTHTNQFVWP